MLIIDIILLILLLGAAINGWQSGLIRTVASLVGLFLGIIIAGHYFAPLAGIIQPYLGDRENLAKIISFLAIFFAVNGAIGVGAYVVDKIFHLLSFIPFLKTINRLAGAVLGLITGMFFLGLIIVILDKFPFADFITSFLDNSMIVPWLTWAAKLVVSLLPEAVKEIKGTLGI